MREQACSEKFIVFSLFIFPRADAMLKIRGNQELTKRISSIMFTTTKFWIPLDYEILKDHGAFFPRALCDELLFELKLAPVGSVVIRSDKAQLADELTNIQLEYEVIHNQELADEAFLQLQKWEEIHVRACDSSQDNLNS